MTQTRNAQVIPFMRDGSFFYKKGIEAYQNKQTAKSIHLIKRAVDMDPEEPVFLCQLAILLAEEGDYASSNRWLRQIIEDVDPSMSESYFFLANNLAHSGEFEEAKEYLEMYMELDCTGDFREDADALHYLLKVELGQEHTELHRTDPFSTHAVMLLHEGQFEEAEEEAARFTAEQSRCWFMYGVLAEAQIRQGKFDEAAEILNNLMQKEGADTSARCLLELGALMQGNRTKEELEADLSGLYPMDRWERYVLAKVLFAAGIFRRAYHLLRESVPVERAVYLHQLAAAAKYAGYEGRASRLWEQAASMQPEKRERFMKLRSTEADAWIKDWTY